MWKGSDANRAAGRRARAEWAAGPWSPTVFAALCGLAAIIRIGVVLNRELDPDESQHLHAAWLVAGGRVPYRDFWEHHAPLFYYLVAPLTRWFDGQPTVYLAGRGLMAVTAGLSLALTWRLAGRLSRATAAGAVVMLAFLPQFTETSTEIRPDGAALVAWLLALLATVRGGERGTLRWLWVAGLAQGLAITLSLKAAYGAVGLAVVAALQGWLAGRPGSRLASAAARVSSLGGGIALVLAGLTGWVAMTGGPEAVTAMVRQVIGQTWRFVDFSKARPFYASEIGFLVLALTGIALAARAHRLGLARHPVHGALLVSLGVITAALSLPRTPAVYQHAWLPVLPLWAIYAGLALATLLQHARDTHRLGPVVLGGLAVIAGIVLPGGESASYAVRDRLQAQLHLMAVELRATCPGEPVLDGTALYVFRPAAYRYRVLPTGVREWIARGVIAEEEVEGDIMRARARVAYPDKRLRALIGPVADFLASHYVASSEGLLVAGARIRASGGPEGGRAPVDLLVSGPFRLTAEPGIEVAVDGRSVRRGWVRLAAGQHEVTWRGPAGTIGLVAATCPERRALGDGWE